MTTPAEMWDRRFAEEGWPSEPDPYLVELADPLPVGRGLDLGAGPGRNSVWLAAKGWDMTLVDVSQVGLDQASAAAGAAGATVTTIRDDVSTWQPDEAAYDLVVVANLHPGPDGLATLLAGAARALRPGGHLYVVGHHVANLGRHGPRDPERLLTPQRLHDALPPTVRVDVLDARDRHADHGRPDGAQHDTVVLAWASRPTATDSGQQ